MRITGGRLCGRRLGVPPGARTRPTSDRVREGLFASLADLRGAVVLDPYAGGGSLGIEALSRDAAQVVFVERSARARMTLRSNLRALELTPRARVLGGDACAAMRRLGAGRGRSAVGGAGADFDLVLLDPPYAGDEAWRALRALRDSAILAPGARIVVERGRDAALCPPVEGFVRRGERRYGGTRVLLYAAQPEAAEPPTPTSTSRRGAAGEEDR